MTIYRKESLEQLRQRVDLVDVLSSHLDLKRAGAAYKALCPFHDEKTPSFVVQKGDSHYHCFGCGAHGDAIGFLMNYQRMSFHEAVESLAERFHVHLETVESGEENRGPSKTLLREALQGASELFHYLLLHTKEGHQALHYLYKRGLDLDFIKQFQVGLSPKDRDLMRSLLHGKSVSDDVMVEAGLLRRNEQNQVRPFFSDRIMFPIHAPGGYVIGFSGRKYREETFGGKYVNTSETVLFKKSRVLYGLNYCRRRIAKERKAIIVEGQIDALRLIQAGFNITVAGQGTAFGEGHVKELTNLGVQQVYLAMDSDTAGQEAACKIGNLFQKEGVEVMIVEVPDGGDPDSFLSEKGPKAFLELLETKKDYLSFLVEHHSRHLDMDSPAAKNSLVQTLTKQIRQWDHPLMVHESLRKLAQLTHVPENIIGVNEVQSPNVYIKKQANIGLQTIDPDRILETDFLRWLILMSGTAPEIVALAADNIDPESLKVTTCRQIYQVFMQYSEQEKPCDLLELVSNLDDAEGQLTLSELLQKKINKEKAFEGSVESIQKILNRNWMEKREAIKMKIQGGNCSDDEVMAYVRAFDDLKKEPPKVRIPQGVSDEQRV